MPYELQVKNSFSAAHQLRGYRGGCENLHGHNWDVEVSVQSDVLDNIGIAIDFRALKKKIKTITDQLDHIVINEHPDFRERNPTSEIIAQWIYEKMKNILSGSPVTISRVTVWETEGCAATYRE